MNVFAMFGPQCTEFELQIKDALQDDGVLWLSGRRPQGTSVFHPRISGIWSVFLMVGGGFDGLSGTEESEPPDSVKSTFPELLRESPAFLLVHGAELLWPGWAEWQQLVTGGCPDIRVTCLTPAATPLMIVAALRFLTSPSASAALVGSVAI